MKLRVAKWEQKDGDKYSENGLIRINPNKPTYGSIMLIATVVTLSGGFLNKRNRVGFIVGEVSELEDTITEYGLKEGTDYSEAISPHRIVRLEKVQSDVPIDKSGTMSGYREKINPTSEEVLTKDGEPIYQTTEVVPEGSDVQDELISHDIAVDTDDASKGEFSKQKVKTEK